MRVMPFGIAKPLDGLEEHAELPLEDVEEGLDVLGAKSGARGLLLVASRREARPPLLDELLLVVLVGEPVDELVGGALGLVESALSPHVHALVVGCKWRVVRDVEAQELGQLAVGFSARGDLGYVCHAGRALPKSPLLSCKLHEFDRRLEPLDLRLAFGARVRVDCRELVFPFVRIPELRELAGEEVGGSRPECLGRCLAGRVRC